MRPCAISLQLVQSSICRPRLQCPASWAMVRSERSGIDAICRGDAGAMQTQTEDQSRTQSQVQSKRGGKRLCTMEKFMSQSSFQSQDVPRQCFLRSDPWSLTGGRQSALDQVEPQCHNQVAAMLQPQRMRRMKIPGADIVPILLGTPE